VRYRLAPFLSPEGYQPPAYWSLAKELHVAPELGLAAVRVASGTVRRRKAPEPGEPVLLLPGFLAGDYSLGLLARSLRAEGYRTYRSTIRSNMGCLDGTARHLERRLETIVERREQKVSIVGHSLGGMLGRGLALRRPDLVSGVIAMGSPLMAPGTAHPLLISAASVLVALNRTGLPWLLSEDCVAGECARTTWEEFHGELDPAVDFACIYSTSDGLVDWRSCVHPTSVPIQVRASHLGMAVSPHVHDEVVAELRRQQAGRLARAA